MGGFNLPPGCSVSDIPGNRPEDLKEEAFWDALYEKFTWMDLDHPDEIDQEKLEDLVNWVRTETWKEAYDAGAADQAEAEYLKRLDPQEMGE